MSGAGVGVVAVTALAVGLTGGLDRVPPPELPVVAVDQPNEGQPWNVTVSRAVLAADLDPVLPQEDGYFLAVVATVEVTADETRGDVYDILCVTGIDGFAREHDDSPFCPDGTLADDVRLVRDPAEPAGHLHPGLPEQVAFLWELAAGTPPPAGVHVEIIGKTYRESTLTGLMEWLDEAPRAQLTVPVEDRRDQP